MHPAPAGDDRWTLELRDARAGGAVDGYAPQSDDILALGYLDAPELPRAWDHIVVLVEDRGPGGAADAAPAAENALFSESATTTRSSFAKCSSATPRPCWPPRRRVRIEHRREQLGVAAEPHRQRALEHTAASQSWVCLGT